MSWAAHDPEGWDEVCKDALVAYLDSFHIVDWQGVVPALVNAIYENDPSRLARLAAAIPSTFIYAAEANYHLRQVHPLQ